MIFMFVTPLGACAPFALSVDLLLYPLDWWVVVNKRAVGVIGNSCCPPPFFGLVKVFANRHELPAIPVSLVTPGVRLRSLNVDKIVVVVVGQRHSYAYYWVAHYCLLYLSLSDSSIHRPISRNS